MIYLAFSFVVILRHVFSVHVPYMTAV